MNYLPGHLLATISSSPCANRLQLITPSMQSPYPWIFKSTPSVPVQIGPLASSLQSLPHAMINDFKSINNDRKFSDIDHLKCFWEICSSYEIFFDKTKCCLSIQHLILVWIEVISMLKRFCFQTFIGMVSKRSKYKYYWSSVKMIQSFCNFGNSKSFESFVFKYNHNITLNKVNF